MGEPIRKGTQNYFSMILLVQHKSIAHTSALLFWSGTKKLSTLASRSIVLQCWGNVFGLSVT